MEVVMFKLNSKYSPTGDQPEAIKSLLKALSENVKDQTLLGVTGSGKTFTIANIIKETGRAALILAPNKTLAAQLYSEYKSFFPENAVEYFVSYYDYYQPEAYIASTDTYIEKDSSINDEIDKLRNAATAALINRKDVIIVASVSAIYGLGSPEIYKKLTIAIDRKTGYNRKKLISKLIELRYERNDTSFERGKFRVKGDVIDIYPSYMESGYRIEFWGDDIEEISEINTLTGQKIKKNIERIAISPATHYVTEEGEQERIIEDIKKDLQIEVQNFENSGKLLEAQRLKQRTEYDLEMIREVGYCKGIENYSRYLTRKTPGEKPDTLMDYFPKDFIVYIDESHIGVPQIRGMYNGDRARKTALVENGFRLKSALDNRPLTFDEFRGNCGQTIFVTATPGDFEIEKSSGHISEQLVRPTGILDPKIEVRETKNQVDNLLEEIRKNVEKKERVLITTLTKKMAEELTEFYLTLGVRVKYMHSDIDTLERIEIIKGLRKGEFDVLVGINLLREGLDIPEVSLVAILEADKEGFLRSKRSLVQTIGRAARNVDGRVILYGDVMTQSMCYAIDETNRRRVKQHEYNLSHGIEPKTIYREVSESVFTWANEEEKIIESNHFTSKQDIEKEISKLLKEIKKLSEELDFEKAISKRDEMNKLKMILLEL
ncbi:excinuclease ABC subunit UvrB [uncultured Cetobacterium sp.]|uniref:excinuclease ABC subunit UvrB n=1 Tax=uncultured Cetobacterium sp. TaxID=527638 RepID=UPI00262D58FE|nr:excinuclease ABC subunit UvrB [uncultured Cetobacterium sp.]